jgi:coenzyme F420-reducing hydrogenase beta subunit
MKEVCDRKKCCGCMSCQQICPHGAITIRIDKEGFERPNIDEKLCIDCGLCKKACPIVGQVMAQVPVRVYSGWSTDEDVRLSSSSGGAFTEIARPFLEEWGGVVFGCSLNEDLQAEHVYVESMGELRRRLSGSKYVQSRIGNSYSRCKEFLQQGRKVLFCGTPCQIAGLKLYLRKDYENLFTVDLICHGVPSPRIFEDYKNFIQSQEKMELFDVRFRCKKSSWIFFNITLKGYVEKTGKIQTYRGEYYKDIYIRGFLRDYFLRPSCHECKFTTIKRTADFTIADWWGYKRSKGESRNFEKKGVSLLFINTSKGEDILSKIEGKMSLRERTIQEALATNSSLQSPFPASPQRNAFWDDYNKYGFEFCAKKYMSPEKLNKTALVQTKIPPSLFRDIVMFSIRVYGKLRRMIKKDNAL